MSYNKSDNTAKAAKKFVAENQIENLNYDNLKDSLNKLGFEIIRFNRLDSKTKAMFESMRLDESTAKASCFVYLNGNSRYVFLAEHLSEKEYIFMLLHEIGHIKLNHLLQNCTYTNQINEIEANEFAFEVIRSVQQQKLLKSGAKLFACLCLLIFSSCNLHSWRQA